MSTTIIQETYKVGDIIIYYQQGDFFNSSGEIALDLTNFPRFGAGEAGMGKTGQHDLRLKICWKLKSITFKMVATTAKQFRIDIKTIRNATALGTIKLDEEAAFVGTELILMDGIDFEGIYSFFHYEPKTKLDFQRILELVLPMQTLSNNYLQVVTTWQEIIQD